MTKWQLELCGEIRISNIVGSISQDNGNVRCLALIGGIHSIAVGIVNIQVIAGDSRRGHTAGVGTGFAVGKSCITKFDHPPRTVRYQTSPP